MAYEFYLNTIKGKKKRKKETCEAHQRKKHIQNVLIYPWKLVKHFY